MMKCKIPPLVSIKRHDRLESLYKEFHGVCEKVSGTLLILAHERKRPLPSRRALPMPKTCGVCPVQVTCNVVWHGHEKKWCRLNWRRLRRYMSKETRA